MTTTKCSIGVSFGEGRTLTVAFHTATQCPLQPESERAFLRLPTSPVPLRAVICQDWPSSEDVVDRDEAESRIRSLGPWFHQIEILPGLWTRDVAPMPGPQPRNHPHNRWAKFAPHFPADMRGIRALDAGCADGYIAIELAKRGANVLAVDAAGNMIERLRWAAGTLGLSNLEARVGKVEDLSGDERFDVVLCLALLYHLKDPLRGLESLSRVTDTLYLETTTHPGDEPFLWLKPPQPGVHAQPKWYPTVSCVVEMLRWVGFSDVERLVYAAKHRASFIARR